MKKVLLGILVLLIIAQFIQPSRNEGSATSANDITHTLKVPDTIMRILQTSCYDCHSDKTNYPWYSRITPVNWWLKNHVDDGKKGLNFSVFNNYSFKRKDHKLEEIAEIVGEHEMPLESYLWIHKDAKLDDVQRKAIIDWAKLSRQQVMQDSLEQKDVSDAKLQSEKDRIIPDTIPLSPN